jgi:hypothetical protein
VNWSDERYVKLYVRNTATWVLWPWQARAVFPSMLKAMNGAGIIETGSGDPLTALSVLIAMPREVVEVGLSAIIESRTIESIRDGYLMPKFIEAQEATKTDSLRKRDQRERQRAQARAIPRVDVTRGHEVSRAVPLQPSPAQPTTSPPPAQPIPEATADAVDLVIGRMLEVQDQQPANDVVNAWNRLPKPFPKVATLTSKRKATVLARLREVPEVGRWRSAIALLPASPFLRGENERGWVANFDWLMRPDTLTKLEEGNYSGTAPTRPKSLAPARAEDSRAAFEAMANMTPEEREQAALEAFAS